jgi:hypothetical protein
MMLLCSATKVIMRFNYYLLSKQSKGSNYLINYLNINIQSTLKD